MKPDIPAEYRPYDPADPTDAEISVLRQLAWHPVADPLTVRGFGVFSMVLSLGYRKVTYETHALESGHLFWLTDEHADAIGRVMEPGMDFLGLVMTTLAGDGFSVLSEAIVKKVTIPEVLVKHTSGDEVTPLEAAGLAKLVTRLEVRTFSLWAGEFHPDALDQLVDVLTELDNRTLQVLDVCDMTRPEPDDQIPVPRLDELLARNRAR